jgi:hypothetical protein
MSEVVEAVRLAFKDLRRWSPAKNLDDAERWVLSGDRAALVRVGKTFEDSNVFQSILVAPPQMGEIEHRLLQLMVQAQRRDAIRRWMEASRESFPDVVAVLASYGMTETDVRKLAVQTSATSELQAGFVLAAGDAELREVLTATAGSWGHLALAEAMCRTQPERAGTFAVDFWQAAAAGSHRDRMAETLLAHEPCRAPLGAQREADPDASARWTLSWAMAARDPGEVERAVAEGLAMLNDPSIGNEQARVAERLATLRGEAVVADIVACVGRWLRPPDARWCEPGNHVVPSHVVYLLLAKSVEVLKRKAVPVAVAVLDSPVEASERREALKFLWKHVGKAHQDLVHQRTAEGLAHKDGWVAAGYVELLPKDPSPMVAELWHLLGHSQKAARDAAVQALKRTGEAAIPGAVARLQDERPKVREAAVALLGMLGPAATEALARHAKAESSDKVRDAILHTLEKGGADVALSPAEIAERAASMPKLKKPIARRLDLAKLPALKLDSGEPVDAATVRWMLWRQSRVKDTRLDIEAGPLVKRIARHGDFGLALVEGFLAGGGTPDEKWLLVLAGTFGDDRIVPLLAPRLREWGEKNYWKQAQFAIAGLGLLGTEQALSLLDALSVRLRGKRPLLAQAAADAVTEAAAARGLDRDELADRMVPWLGFERGRPRVVEAGSRRLLVEVGADWKPTFRDEATGKRVAALPKGAPAAVTKEMKELGASLREMSRAQVGRLEDLLVRQRRWTPAAWRALFLEHPLLRPFGNRLVFGHWLEHRLAGTFRALFDLSLTDASDETFALGEAGQVGIVHPLELSDDDRAAWDRHLADHEVIPPFAQLARIVVRPSESERKLTSKRLDAELAGLTFRGRAEKRGWRRGSVGDAAMVHSYWKEFATAGVDAFVEIDGLQAFADPDDEVALRSIWFARHGSVSPDRFEDEGLGGSRDERLLKFGDVPPIVYSEVMADVAALGA